MSPKESVEVFIASKDEQYTEYAGLIKKLTNVSKLEYTTESIPNSKSFIIGTDEVFIPIEFDVEKERAEMEVELKRQKGFLIGVGKKLGNERFVDNAPEAVIASERKKQADAEARIVILEKSLAELG